MLLIERLQKALGPEYAVERELAGGGMGVVFLATHRRLARRVAIKVLRPELATAIAAERFVAEGRLLATLAPHPNIVSVYDAKENGGLLFFVMEFVEGETLASRLERGPLAPDEVVRLAGDLLAALGAAHAQHIVHRDVKPANIFLRRGRALLGDFGIARWRETNDPGFTTPGQLIGTPRYMSPEQQEGEPVTAFTDVYAAALVLYEACTGQRWPAYQAPEQGEWREVPQQIATPMRRALALAPSDRWSDGGAFGEAITPSRRVGLGSLLGVGGALAGIVAAILLARGGGPSGVSATNRAGVTLAVAPFSVQGHPTRRWLGDSVRAALSDALSGYPDFSVRPDDAADDSLAVIIGGTVHSTDGALTLHLTVVAPGVQAIALNKSGKEDDWRLLADSLVNGLVRAIWQEGVGADPSLPVDALPRSDRGFSLWLKAEQYLSQARWDEADIAYGKAEREDPTCYLCSFRRLDIDRWLGNPQDTARLARLGRVRDSFPAHYQSLINAALTPLPARLDTLRAAAATYPNFFLASFEYGDELFHRGPLFGRPRSDAIEPLRLTVQLRPRFGPGWEHLAWVLLSEGDAAAVRSALDGLERAPSPASGFSAALRVLLSLGEHWRFSSPDSAEQYTNAVLSDPQIIANKDAVAGARLLMTTDAPNGAVAMGRMLTKAWPGRADAVRGGLLGQMYGFAALGRLDSVRAVGLRLGREARDQSLPLLALELEAVLRRFDPDTTLRRDSSLIRALRDYMSPGAYSGRLRRRAGWALGLLSTGRGDTILFAHAQRALADEPAPARMRRTLEAGARAGRGDVRGALDALPESPGFEPLPDDDEGSLDDTAARLFSAEWLELLKRPNEALQVLLWQEHLFHRGHLAGPPQRAEGSWAVGTLARWHRTRLFGPADVAARCAAFASVERRWKEGEPLFTRRADEARAAIARECKAPS